MCTFEPLGFGKHFLCDLRCELSALQGAHLQSEVVYKRVMGWIIRAESPSGVSQSQVSITRFYFLLEYNFKCI